MKKILFTIIGILTINLLFFAFNANNQIFAADLDEETFEVQKHLNLDNDQQDTSYFNSNEKSNEKTEEEGKQRSPIVNFAIRVIDFAVRIIGSLAMLLFIVAGFWMMSAQGNQQQIDNAKEIFKYAVFGLLFVFFSYTIVLLLQTLFSHQ